MLIYGECLEEMAKLPDNSIDFCLTDPPYGTTACKWDNVIPFEPMWEQLKRIVKDNGAICLFGSEPFSSHLRISNIKMYKYDWVWQKNTVTGLASAKYMPMKDNELISVFYKKSGNYYPIKQPRVWKGKETNINKYEMRMGMSSEHQKDMTKRDKVKYEANLVNPKRVQFFNTEPNAKGKLHPTQKPVPLLEYLIKTYTLESETVLDFTMGSGSTGVACKNLNRKFIGIENDEKYFNIARERINEL